METPHEQHPEAPEWIARTKDALERFRGLSGKKRKQKLPLTHRDVERELSWHEAGREKGKLTEEQYWKAVAQTLHDFGVEDFAYGAPER